MTVFLSHATSFCAAVWRPVIMGLADMETVAWDQPGHGAGPSLELPVDWRVFGEFVLDVTEPGGIGVGHSMGAAALVMAQASDPDRFRALVLVEPVMFPGPYVRADNAMSDRALRRRRTFPSRGEAAESFRERGAFVGWDPEAFAGYIECGLVGEDEVSLACAPEVEADIYRGSGAHDTWERASSIEIPVLVMSGGVSETVTPEIARAQGALFRRGIVDVVEEAGHFLPMERPHAVAHGVRRLGETIDS